VAALRFPLHSAAEVTEKLRTRLAELNLMSSMAILSAIEAAFRIDYLQRSYKRRNDPLSQSLRKVYKRKQQRASLEEDIFESWCMTSPAARATIGELRSAFKFRHWLAHGRYWVPKFGREYDYVNVFALAQATFDQFPLFGHES
jgi:hypothetical protein